jgi:hypothetical protein
MIKNNRPHGISRATNMILGHGVTSCDNTKIHEQMIKKHPLLASSLLFLIPNLRIKALSLFFKTPSQLFLKVSLLIKALRLSLNHLLLALYLRLKALDLLR